MVRRAPVTIEDIEFAMDEVALAIDMAGAKGAVYLPIFERLERELACRRRSLTSLDLARERARRLDAERLPHMRSPRQLSRNTY